MAASAGSFFSFFGSCFLHSFQLRNCRSRLRFPLVVQFAPGSAGLALVVPETPGPPSPSDELVLSTPAPGAVPPPPGSDDPILTRMKAANDAGMRKRRMLFELSPEAQVSLPAPKHRLVSVKSNISQYFSRWLTVLRAVRWVSRLGFNLFTSHYR